MNVIEQVLERVDSLKFSIAALDAEIEAVEKQISTAKTELNSAKDPSDKAGSVASVVRQTLALDERRRQLHQAVESLSADKAGLLGQRETEAAQLADWEQFLSELEAFAAKAKELNHAVSSVRDAYSELLAEAGKINRRGYHFKLKTIFEENSRIKLPVITVNSQHFRVRDWQGLISELRSRWYKENNYPSGSKPSEEELFKIYGDGGLF